MTTYRTLIDQLGRIPANRLDDTVTVVVDGEVYEARLRIVKDTDTDIGDVLDDGHPVLEARTLS